MRLPATACVASAQLADTRSGCRCGAPSGCEAVWNLAADEWRACPRPGACCGAGAALVCAQEDLDTNLNPDRCPRPGSCCGAGAAGAGKAGPRAAGEWELEWPAPALGLSRAEAEGPCAADSQHCVRPQR